MKISWQELKEKLKISLVTPKKQNHHFGYVLKNDLYYETDIQFTDNDEIVTLKKCPDHWLLAHKQPNQSETVRTWRKNNFN